MIDRSISTLLGLCDDQSAANSSSVFCHDPSDNSSFAKPTMIRFAQMEEVYEVPTVKDFSLEETQAMWYDTKEYDIFNDECEMALAKIESGIHLRDKKYSSIGLEGWTKDGERKRRRNRVESLDVVLDEQFAQWKDGIEDFDTIAELYIARSEHCQMVAVTRGLVMEREVQEYLATTMDQCNDSLSSLTFNSAKSVHSNKSKSPKSSSGKPSVFRSLNSSLKTRKSPRTPSKTSSRSTTKSTATPPKPSKKKRDIVGSPNCA
jgi:hypothetical protein